MLSHIILVLKKLRSRFRYPEFKHRCPVVVFWLSVCRHCSHFLWTCYWKTVHCGSTSPSHLTFLLTFLFSAGKRYCYVSENKIHLDHIVLFSPSKWIHAAKIKYQAGVLYTYRVFNIETSLVKVWRGKFSHCDCMYGVLIIGSLEVQVNC